MMPHHRIGQDSSPSSHVGEADVSTRLASADPGFIEVGCSTNLLNNPEDILGTLKRFPQSLRVVEIEIEEGARVTLAKSTASQRRQFARVLRRLSARQGRRLVVHAPWHGRELSLCAPGGGFPEIAIAALLFAIDFAEHVEANIVTIHPGLHEGQPEKVLVENLLRNLEPAALVADRAGIVVCLETMGGRRSRNALLSPESHARLCDELGIRVCLDIPHAASRVRSEEELLATMQVLMPMLGHIHLADTRFGVHRHMPIGRGELDLRKLLGILLEGGYDGVAVVEEWNRGYSSDEFLFEAARFAGAMAADE